MLNIVPSLLEAYYYFLRQLKGIIIAVLPYIFQMRKLFKSD